MRQRFAVLAAALWWGSLTAIGALAVPVLFASLPPPAMAGYAAARLFAAQMWVSVGCGVLLLVLSCRSGDAVQPAWAGAALLFVLAGLLLALVTQFGVAPRIVARENLRVWHTVGSVLYALQWVCSLVVLSVVTGPKALESPDAGRDASS